MIIAAYYLGLIAWSVLVLLPAYLTEEWHERILIPLYLALSAYLGLGWFLFGWKLAVANFVILVVAANFIDIPLDRLIKRFFPNAKVRMPYSPECQAKIRRLGKRLGINRHK